MKKPLTHQSKIVTIIVVATAMLIAIALLPSCSSSKSCGGAIYGNQDSQCGAYQCIEN